MSKRKTKNNVNVAKNDLLLKHKALSKTPNPVNISFA